MITVLAVDPSFGAAYNVKEALSELDETVLICTHLDKWRKRPEGTIDYHVTSLNRDRCASLVRESRFTFLVGGSATTVMSRLTGYERWIKSLNLAAWFTDTYYRKQGQEVNELLESWGCDRYFALPDDVYMQHVPEQVVPLMHPINLRELREKPDEVLVLHSPGTPTKRTQKGSDHIEEVITKLQHEFDFTYECLMRLPHEECLKRKDLAHIFIDKLPSGHSIGVGKSGLEGLAAGSVVLCPTYDLAFWRAYPENPPIIDVRLAFGLEKVLRKLLSLPAPELRERGLEGRRWIESYCGLENGAWLKYFRQWVDL